MAAPKLQPRHRKMVLGWLCAGMSDAEIVGELQARFNITCTVQNINLYRQKWLDQIDAAEEQMVEAAKREGWGRRSKRIRFLARQLDKLEEKFQAAQVSGFAGKGFGIEARNLIAELRRELGQDRPTKIEADVAVSGPVPLPVFSEADPLNHFDKDGAGDCSEQPE